MAGMGVSDSGGREGPAGFLLSLHLCPQLPNLLRETSASARRVCPAFCVASLFGLALKGNQSQCGGDKPSMVLWGREGQARNCNPKTRGRAQVCPFGEMLTAATNQHPGCNITRKSGMGVSIPGRRPLTNQNVFASKDQCGCVVLFEGCPFSG